MGARFFTRVAAAFRDARGGVTRSATRSRNSNGREFDAAVGSRQGHAWGRHALAFRARLSFPITNTPAPAPRESSMAADGSGT